MWGSQYFGPAILFMGVLFAPPFRAWGIEGTGGESLSEIRKQIRRLEADRSRDLQLMEKLEKRVDQLESENSQLKAASAQIRSNASQAAAQVKGLQAQAEAGPSPKTMVSAVSGYLGSHTFTLSGSAGVGFIYNQQSSAYTGFPNQTQNAFFLDWEPMVLYRPNDWMLFQGVLAAAIATPVTVEADLSAAQKNYQTFCVKCHGDTGKGDGSGAATLTTKMRPTRARWRWDSITGSPLPSSGKTNSTLNYRVPGGPS